MGPEIELSLKKPCSTWLGLTASLGVTWMLAFLNTLYSYLPVRSDNSTYITVLLGGFNGVKSMKHLSQIWNIVHASYMYCSGRYYVQLPSFTYRGAKGQRLSDSTQIITSHIPQLREEHLAPNSQSRLFSVTASCFSEWQTGLQFRTFPVLAPTVLCLETPQTPQKLITLLFM